MIARLSVFTLALLAIPSSVAEQRLLSPSDSIGAVIRSERANANARFSIQAEKSDGTEFAFDVVEASNPALTPGTILKHGGGESSIGEGVLHTLLVSDLSSASGVDTFALLAVDPDDNVHGIVDAKGNKPMKIKQNKGKKATAEEETEHLEAPDWNCDADHADVDGGLFDRRLEEEEHHHHDHDHHDHDHHHHDHDHHDHKVESAMKTLSKQLRGTKINPMNKPRRLQSSSSYNYQVDMYLEIDNAFVSISGGTLSSALNYINSLVTAANQIYEKEIDTHLNVAVVDLNTVYDASTSTSDALAIMRAEYANSVWHTAGIDLHHALLGKGLGGGIAYIGVLCRSDYGYGLTASINGSFLSLDYRVVWDLVAFTHELGHNFNSRHTHDEAGYSPVVDTCGTTCPASSTNEKWSTIMSYCHLCAGSYGNQMYTFGGEYSGNGLKTDLNNWINDAQLMANGNADRSSNDPRRVAHKMYSHVQSKTASGCLAVPSTSAPTNSPITSAPVPITASPTKAPVTAAPITASPTKAPVAAANCEDPSMTQQQCVDAPNCEWIKRKRNWLCQFSESAPSPPSPTPPTTPNPTEGGGGGSCDAIGAFCTADSGNCCNGCQMKGKNKNTCK